MDYINLNLQPGDATRYIVVITEGPDCPYVVIGAGDSCSGMYVPHHHINTVPHLLRSIAESPDAGWSTYEDCPTLDYQVSKSGIGRYTTFIGMIMAWLWRTNPYLLEERAYAIINPMSGRRSQDLIAALDEERKLAAQGGAQ